ncbi:MAG: redoxin domain-containing protein [Dehalococcoidales bacterium]|jgi:peroxiredoxin|nr:redoxin domain-containing protein [Dehalococcoidales bacterium]
MSENKQYDAAPDFTAVDSSGRQITLSEYKGKKNVLLIFNRGFQ